MEISLLALSSAAGDNNANLKRRIVLQQNLLSGKIRTCRIWSDMNYSLLVIELKFISILTNPLYFFIRSSNHPPLSGTVSLCILINAFVFTLYAERQMCRHLWAKETVCEIRYIAPISDKNSGGKVSLRQFKCRIWSEQKQLANSTCSETWNVSWYRPLSWMPLHLGNLWKENTANRIRACVFTFTKQTEGAGSICD